jgi:hypothetical protein
MQFLPIENITYKTSLKESEVIEKLRDLVGQRKFFALQNDTKPYKGKINGNTFKMEREINYRNSFLPTIQGSVIKDFNGTVIKVKMRLSIPVIVFMSIWFGGVGIGCLLVLAQLFTATFNPMFLIPFGMLLFGYFLTMRAFKHESKRSKKDLAELLRAEIVETPLAF